MRLQERPIRIASLAALAIGALGCVVFAFFSFDGNLLHNFPVLTRIFMPYALLAVAVFGSRGRFAAAVVLFASLATTWVGVSAYVDLIRYPNTFDIARFFNVKQLVFSSASFVVAGASWLIHRMRRSPNVA